MTPPDPIADARRLGLRASQIGAFVALGRDDAPCRVAAVDRGLCTLWRPRTEGPPEVLRARPGPVPIVVGDFVVCESVGGEPTVTELLPRRSLLQRGSAHRAGEVQRIAANLDTVFVVAAFALTDKLQRRALQARRLDRFIAAVRDGGATPVVVLNKRDVAREDDAALTELVRDLRARLGGVEVVTTSAARGDGIEALRIHMPPGDTVAFIGPSGVGKSTLTNAVLGERAQAEGVVREVDAKGRHTTTRGALFETPQGAFVVDTPGVRQFALVDADGPGGFEDVEALAGGCRFSDCGHGPEPGCAVRAAVEDGSLPAARLQAYLALRAELQKPSRPPAGHEKAEQHAAERRFGRMVRAAGRHRRGK